MKRIGALIITCLLSITLAYPASALTYGEDINPEEKNYQQIFLDIPQTHWAFRYISELVQRGAISGYPDGKYYPNATVTRAQFSKIMVMAADVAPITVSSTGTGFIDVPSNYWGATYIMAAKPYMTAYRQSSGQFTFKPNQPALREDIAVAVVKLKGYDVSTADLDALRTMFSDYDSISSSIRPYIAAAVEHGVISGYSDGTFRGQRSVTRAEAAAILWRAFQKGNDDKTLPGENNSQPTNQQPSNSTQGGNTTDGQAQNTVESIAAVPSGTDAYTFNQSGEIYYLKHNKLYKIEDGKTQELFNGDQDYYKEIKSGDMVEALLDGPEEFYWDGIKWNADSDNLLYFDHLELKQLGYNQAEDTVYVYAESNMAYDGLATFYIHAIFDAEEMDNPVKEFAFGESDDYLPTHGMICGNGVLVYSNYSAGDWAVNGRNGTAVNYGRSMFDCDNSDYININGTIYSFGGRWGWNLSKLNLSSYEWEDINLADNAIYSSTAVGTYDGNIIFAGDDGLYRLVSAGTNRMKSVQFLRWSDLNILDGLPFGDVDEFLMDSQGNILFIDNIQHMLRKITIGETM